MGGYSDLLIDVEDVLGEIHARTPRPSYKQALKELKKEEFESRFGETFTLGEEAKDAMEAVLESKGHGWASDWTEDEDEEELTNEAVTSPEGGAAIAEGEDKKRPRPEDGAETTDQLPNEPPGVTRRKQQNAAYDYEMRALKARIGIAMHEALSGNQDVPGLDIHGVSLGAWNALVAHLCGMVVDQDIEFERDELLEHFEKAQLEAKHCLPGTSKRLIIKTASFGWKAEPPHALAIEQAMSYGFEPEHQGRLSIEYDPVLRGE